MNSKSLICPNCGAPIKPADGSRKDEKCMYCGNQVWLGKNTLYSSLIDGFESLDSVETHCRTSMETNMKLLIRDLEAE